MNEAGKNDPGHRILLTGGAGFLGSFLIQELLDPESPLPVKMLRILDLKEMEPAGDERLEYLAGDVRDPVVMAAACVGIDLVIHSAAVVDWGTQSEEEVLSVNFGGTRQVIESAKEAGVKALLYTSSLDVLVDGKPKVGVDEGTPYPEKHATSYCKSKYMAEKLVRSSDSEGFATTALRPADIYGEGDPYHMGSLIAQAEKGIYVSIGRGRSRCMHVYAGNMAFAHVLAGLALLEGNPEVRGMAYFITDGPPANFFDFFNPLVEASGYRLRPRNLRLPCTLAYVIGAISEWLAILVRPIKKYRPIMSRFAATYPCTDYIFNAERARKDFGFRIKYSAAEATRRTTSWYHA